MQLQLVRRLSLLAVLAATFAACVPTSSRKNARLQDGFDLELNGGLQYAEAGEDSAGNASPTDEFVHAEMDLQYAFTQKDGSGFAIQAKVPLSIVFTSLDFYYQLPDSTPKWYFGFGAEVGVLPGVYAVATHYLNESLYLTLTPRVLSAQERGTRAVLLNPQLAIGNSGPVDFSVFINFAHHTGTGFNFDIDLFGSDDDGDDYRTNFWLIGAAARF